MKMPSGTSRASDPIVATRRLVILVGCERSKAALRTKRALVATAPMAALGKPDSSIGLDSAVHRADSSK